MSYNDSIVLETEDGETLELYVLEKTRINGKDYLLAADSSLNDEDSDEAECFLFRVILKQFMSW